MLAGIVVKNMYSVARWLDSAFDLNSSMSPYGNDTDPMSWFQSSAISACCRALGLPTRTRTRIADRLDPASYEMLLPCP